MIEVLSLNDGSHYLAFCEKDFVAVKHALSTCDSEFKVESNLASSTVYVDGHRLIYDSDSNSHFLMTSSKDDNPIILEIAKILGI